MAEQPSLLFFRKRLLAYSETFIVNQGKFLPNYKAWFTGIHKMQSGYFLLDGHEYNLMEDYARWPALSKLGMRTLGRVSPDWVNQLASLSPQLIHAHFGTDGVTAMPIARKLGLPMVVTFHGYDITDHKPYPRYARARPTLFKKADKIIAVSEFIKSKLIEKGCPESKIQLHRIGIDTQQFAAEDRQEADRPTIVFVGRLVSKKGCDHLLQAIKQLQSKYHDLHTIIVGDGVLREDLEGYAREFHLNVDFVGRQPPHEVKRYMEKAWIFCAPSVVADSGNAEGLPTVLVEAQSLGIPCVTYASGGNAEAVSHQYSGFVAKERDIEALTDYLDQLLSDKQLRKQFGDAARKRAENEFDVRKQCAALEGIYNSVV